MKIVFTLAFLTNSLVTVAIEKQLANGEQLNLFGIGVHQEKRNDIYVGAMFATPGVTTKKQLFDVSTNKRMSIKFLTSYSNRKMSRFLKQRISMNNRKDSWKPFTKQIVQLSKIFKRSLQKGDEINVDYIANKGTQVYLNQTLFFEEKSHNFYNILLNIWFGSIPPSEAFKVGINGKNTAYQNDEFISRFESLITQIGRFDGDKIESAAPRSGQASNINNDSKVVKPIAKKSLPAKKQIAKKVASNSNSTNDKPQQVPVKKKSVNIDTPAIKLDSLLTKPILLQKADVVEKTVNKSPSIGSVKSEAPLENSENKTADKLPTKQQSLAAEKIPPTVPDETNIDDKNTKPEVDLDLISGSYTQELIATIRNKQSYPSKALKQGIEGSVVVQLVVNQEGDIERQSLLKRSGSKVLDRGVLRMLKKAEPYPKIPSELELEEFEIEIPLSFAFSE